MSTDAGARTVVICGSMKHMELMKRISDFLRSAGLDVVAPAPDEPADWTIESLRQLKRVASRRHMDHIRDRRTAAVLVVNVDRPGTKDYVGPNAFAEIGVAFSDDRLVFLLQGMPASYADELWAWGVNCLNGDVRPLLDALNVPCPSNLSAWWEALHRSRLV